MPAFQSDERGPSPIELLSRDLLTFILELVYDSFDRFPNNLFIGASRSQALVYIKASHVCRFWRFVALENPLWWTRINIRPPWKIEAVDAFLKRSKQCRLEVKFTGFDAHYKFIAGHSPSDYQQLLDLMMPHFHRCRILHLHALFHSETAIPFSSFQALSNVDMASLEEFILDDAMNYCKQEPPERRYNRIFKSAPVLRNLGLSGIDFSMMHQPSYSVTALHLSRGGNTLQIPLTNLKAVLESYQSLNTLALYDDFLDFAGPDHGSVEVPSLENLYILGQMLWISDLLLFLKTPKLANLVIMPVMDFSLRAFAHTTIVCDDHPFPLKSLTLSPQDFDSLTGIRMASMCFPSIERLILIDADIYKFVHLLTVKGQSIVFPKLKELGLKDLAGRTIKAIRKMGRNRAEQGYPLRTVFVDSLSHNEMFEYMWRDEDVDLPFNLVNRDLYESQKKKFLLQ